jgi:riboflavin-specific deaminase-like protein
VLRLGALRPADAAERSDVRQIFPEQKDPVGPANPLSAAGPLKPGDSAADDLVAALADIYAYPDLADQPWVRANFVASIDGAVTADGRSGVLSGPADRLVFTLLRSLADVVVAGAGTVRAERYRQAQPDELWHQVRVGRPPAPPVAVITRRLDLELSDRLFGQGQHLARTIVLTTELAGEERVKEASRVAEVVVAGTTDMVTAQAIVEALAARGYRRILVEGGPTLLGQLVAERLLDELCLTVSPVLEGGHETGRLTSRRGPVGLTDMRLASVLEDDGFLLTRYVRA